VVVPEPVVVRTAAPHFVFFDRANVNHLHAAFVFLVTLVCAIVGLASGDWYAVERSTVSSAGIPLILTNYFGLRLSYLCTGPATPIPAVPALYSPVGYCNAFTYRALKANAQDTNNGDANDSYDQLIGASGIITAMLAVLILVSFIGLRSNIMALRWRYLSFGYPGPRFLVSRFLMVVAFVLELLVIIFWVTIFPYKFFQNIENASPSTVIFYHTLGLGFAIQIAGLIIAFLGMIWHNPKTPFLVYGAPATVV